MFNDDKVFNEVDSVVFFISLAPQTFYDKQLKL